MIPKPASQPDTLPCTLSTLMGNVMTDEPIIPSEAILHHAEGGDLLPASIELSGMEVSLVNAMSRETMLRQVLEPLKKQYDHILIDCIALGASEFFLGRFGRFDFMCASVLRKLKKLYPHIRIILVLPYLNSSMITEGYDETVYPPLESVPPRFAIVRRHEWLAKVIRLSHTLCTDLAVHQERSNMLKEKRKRSFFMGNESLSSYSRMVYHAFKGAWGRCRQ